MSKSNKYFIVKLKPLLISLLISIGVGLLAGYLTKDNSKIFSILNNPRFSPPQMAFPIVWAILFILMGISAYLIYMSKNPDKNYALFIYSVQLVINFFWSIIFFNLGMYFFSFIWLMILWFFILYMISLFYKIDKKAALLQIPYLLWVTYAAYLNIAIYFLN